MGRLPCQVWEALANAFKIKIAIANSACNTAETRSYKAHDGGGFRNLFIILLSRFLVCWMLCGQRPGQLTNAVRRCWIRTSSNLGSKPESHVLILPQPLSCSRVPLLLLDPLIAFIFRCCTLSLSHLSHVLHVPHPPNPISAHRSIGNGMAAEIFSKGLRTTATPSSVPKRTR